MRKSLGVSSIFGKKVAAAIISWIAGNITWGVGVWWFNKTIAGNALMIQAIAAVGFLVLIVLGVIGTWYLLFREKQGPLTIRQLEEIHRYVAILAISQQHGIKPKDLSDLNDPYAMEERARRLLVEKELFDLKNSQQQP